MKNMSAIRVHNKQLIASTNSVDKGNDSCVIVTAIHYVYFCILVQDSPSIIIE